MNGTQNTRPDCQVLVVGAGPTGLVLAADLLARGVSTRIIDKGDGVTSTRATQRARNPRHRDPRARARGPRPDGPGRPVRGHGQRVRCFTFYTDGKRRVSLDLSLNGTRFGFMLDIPAAPDRDACCARGSRSWAAPMSTDVELTGLADEDSASPHGVVDAPVGPATSPPTTSSGATARTAGSGTSSTCHSAVTLPAGLAAG